MAETDPGPCRAHIRDGDLTCTRGAGHTGGHQFEGSSGVPDRHDKPGRGDSE